MASPFITEKECRLGPCTVRVFSFYDCEEYLGQIVAPTPEAASRMADDGFPFWDRMEER